MTTTDGLGDLSFEALVGLLDPGPGQAAWRGRALPHQLPPDDRPWSLWLLSGGRGCGKTWSGSHWLAERALAEEPGEWCVAAPTFRDARVTCIEGPSGLMAALGGKAPKGKVAHYVRSYGEIRLVNGAVIYGVSADEPERFRGPNLRGAWADELGSWALKDSWDQLRLSVRLGAARIVGTTTPRPTPLIKALVSDPRTALVRATTYDNEANLSEDFLSQVAAAYGDTRLGRQEIYGELLLDTPGALWALDTIEAHRVTPAQVPALTRVVVGVDPAMTSGEGADATGIVVVGSTGRGPGAHYYVLEDATVHATPQRWAEATASAYDRYQADRVVGEVNAGGELVAHTLKAVASEMPVRSVHASRGKRIRAEPIAALYEAGRVHHVGMLAALEDELTTWTPEAPRSPDRLDAVVWALTDLAEARVPRRIVHAERLI